MPTRPTLRLHAAAMLAATTTLAAGAVLTAPAAEAAAPSGPHTVAADPLTATLDCWALAPGEFDCEAVPAGGTAPYHVYWSGTGVRYDYQETTTDAGGSVLASGTCNPNAYVTGRVTVYDATGASVIVRNTFFCG